VWLHPDYLNNDTIYIESHYRLDSIGFGVALALACQLASGRRFLRAISHPLGTAASLSAILVCLVSRDPWFRETLRYTVIGCAIVVLLAGLLFGEALRPVQWLLNTGAMIWIGRLSYSIYVWHEGVASFVPTTGYAAWQVVAIELSGTAAAAVASYYLVEQPFLRLRRYLRTPLPATMLQTSPKTLQAGLWT
jgi:peptidoglycan/LPS O-acetylase OafA/YrhL